jgi:hypothetical protein
MSSSRSIAAARARRAGENANPLPQNRPVTSINSQAAFAQQRMQQSQPMPQGRNVRVATASMAPQRSVHPSETSDQSKRPKLSISDAIGLITLRLGRVESILIEKEHEMGSNNDNHYSIPENMQLVDKSILANIVARIDSLEKNNRDFTSLMNEIKSVKEMFVNLNVKHDTFSKETNERFSDYEVALAEIEKQIPTLEIDSNPIGIDNVDMQQVDSDDILNSTTEFETPIISDDLKSLIRNEVAEST